MSFQRFVRDLSLWFFCAGLLFGQQHTQLSGLVRDPSGAAIPGASISVVSQSTGFRRSTLTGSNGWYTIASLQPGLYKMTARHEGFRTLVRFGLKLDAAQPVQLDLTLPLGSVREVITVSGSPLLLNTEDASVGTFIDRQQIDTLPLNGRGLLSLLEFAPGTVVTPATRGESGQFTTSGQRPNANYFVVDGVSANTGVSGGGLSARSTGGSLPGMTAMGSLHSLVSLEALGEFRVQTSMSTPEFGKLPGAQVLLSSRSGSNDWHGSLFSYFRSGRLDANNWYANRNDLDATATRLNDFGATFGGPLVKNRTFFFLSYEGMRLREPFVWQSASPTAEARLQSPDWLQPAISLLPLPEGRELEPNLAEWSGLYNRNSRLDAASLRVDHAVTSRLTVFARYNATTSSTEFTSTQVNDLNIRSDSFTFGASFRLSQAAVLDLKLNRARASGRSVWRTPDGLAESGCFLAPLMQKLFRTDGACDQLLRLSIGGVGQIDSGAEGDQRQDQWQILPMATLTLGSHQLRAGMDHRRYSPERRDHSDSLAIIANSFEDLHVVRNLWTSSAEAARVRSDLSEYSVFAQDTWRIHSRLTATFGLRWEYARSPELFSLDGAYSPTIAYAFPEQTEIWSNRRANLAPRAAVAYRPAKLHGFVLRAGWGLFYDSTLSIATDLVNGGPLSTTQYRSGQNAPFSTIMSYAFDPGLRLPAVHQWNVTAEGEIGAVGVISASYVGSAGRRLLRREFGGYKGSQTLWLAIATNHGESDYQGLQFQYRRPMSHGLQALASYAWSHSIDNSSSDSVLHRVGPTLGASQDRGSSDFDVRHALNLALTYETDPAVSGTFARRLLRGWGIDGIFRVRAGFPVNVLNSRYSMGLEFANAFRPDLVPGQSVWLADSTAPGGRRLNSDAFEPSSGSSQGSLGRNSIRGFGMHQVDVALRREFKLSERRSLLLRLEAFNVLNHPNFADPDQYLSNPLFGNAPSTLNLMLGTGSPGSGLSPILQTGAARSLQIVLRFRF